MEITNLNKDRKNRRKPSLDLTTMVYGKVPPQAKDLEEAILGGILIDGFVFPEVANVLFKECFYVDAHQRIYGAMISLYDKSQKVDILTTCEELKRLEELDTVGGPYAITKLTNNVVSTANILDHCKIVLEMFLKREAIRISGDIIGEAYEDSSDAFDILDQADNQIINIQERVLSGAVKDMAHYTRMVHEQYESVKVTGVLGIQTGIEAFDRIFSGLVAPDLIIIAARPSQGKTAFCLSLTHNISVVNNIPCAWFSLEMDGAQLTRRIASIDSGVGHELIRRGKASDEEEIRFYNSLKRIEGAPIYIEDKGSINVRSIRTRANVLVRKHGIKYIIVDYLQLISGLDKRNQQREGEVSEISRGLKLLAKELNIPVIALSQLNRKCEERADKMPQSSDLRESGAIEQDADEVMFLMRPEFYKFTEPVNIHGKEYDVKGLCIVKADKNRHGECKNFALLFNAPCMHFKTHPDDLGYSIGNNQNTYGYQSPVKDNSDNMPF